MWSGIAILDDDQNNNGGDDNACRGDGANSSTDNRGRVSGEGGRGSGGLAEIEWQDVEDNEGDLKQFQRSCMSILTLLLWAFEYAKYAMTAR
jgi:hypothetical protein